MINRKRLVVLALIVFCCIGMVFAQGAKAALAERGEKLVVFPDGSYRIEKIAVAAPVVEAEVPAIEAERSYSLVGYDYTFSLSGNKLAFKYLDVKVADAIVKVAPAYVAYYDYVSDAQVEKIKAALKGILEVSSEAEKTGPGVITLTFAKNITEAQFDKFVDAAEKLIYDTIY